MHKRGTTAAATPIKAVWLSGIVKRYLAVHVGIHETPRDIIDHVRASLHSLLSHLSIEGVYSQRHMLQLFLFS